MKDTKTQVFVAKGYSPWFNGNWGNDYYEYMDEIKGYRPTKEKGYQKMYEEKAVYYETISFAEK